MINWIKSRWPFVWKKTLIASQQETGRLRSLLYDAIQEKDYFYSRFKEAAQVINFPSIEWKPSENLNMMDMSTQILQVDWGVRYFRFEIPLRDFEVKGDVVRAVTFMTEAGWLQVEEKLQEDFRNACWKAAEMAVAKRSRR